MAKEKKTLSLVSSKGIVYLNGVEEGTSWQKKLLDKGATKTKDGNLRLGKEADFPDPLGYLEEVIGQKKLYEYVTIDTTQVSGNAYEASKKDLGSLRVITDRKEEFYKSKEKEEKAIIVLGTSKEDTKAHAIIREHGGTFNGKDKDKPYWVIKNPSVKQADLYKKLKAVMAGTIESSKKDGWLSKFKLTADDSDVLIRGDLIKDNEDFKKSFKSALNVSWDKTSKSFRVKEMTIEQVEEVLKTLDPSFVPINKEVSKDVESKKTKPTIEIDGQIIKNVKGAWLQKLVDAGATQTKDGNLEVKANESPEAFIDKVIGLQNLQKYAVLVTFMPSKPGRSIEDIAADVESLSEAEKKSLIDKLSASTSSRASEVR